MAANSLSPVQRARIDTAHGHIAEVVRRPDVAPIVVPYPTPFGCQGPLVAGPSFPFPLPYGFTLDGPVACLGTAGATDTVLTFYLDGAPQFTLTLTASSTAIFKKLGQNVGTYGQQLTVAATTIGTGAANLGGHLLWMALP